MSKKKGRVSLEQYIDLARQWFAYSTWFEVLVEEYGITEAVAHRVQRKLDAGWPKICANMGWKDPGQMFTYDDWARILGVPPDMPEGDHHD